VNARQKTLAQFSRELRARLRLIEQHRDELTATRPE
jgi:hypothetical protein